MRLAKIRPTLVVAVPMAWLAAWPAAAEDAAIACPATLTARAELPSVPGWQAVRSQAEIRPLERIAIRLSPDGSAFVPQSGYLREERGENKTVLASWDLTEARSGGTRLWLACISGGTVIELVRELPGTIAGCEYRVEYTADQLHETGGCR